MRGSLSHRLSRFTRGGFERDFGAAHAGWRHDHGWLQRDAARRLFECDLLWVHELGLAERLVALEPRQARDRLLLMSHSPTLPVCEFAVHFWPEADRAALLAEPAVARQLARELEVMASVRAVVWPSPGAREGYPERLASGTGREAFVTTGVPAPEPREPASAVRASWGVAPGVRLALFMGRPHADKGFGHFVDWAVEARARGAPWLFVQAGDPPRHWRRDLGAVRSVGHVEDFASAYRAADLVLFPNRFAYMDLGLLQCLALGARVAVAPVGGHRDVLARVPRVPRLDTASTESGWASLERAAEAHDTGPAIAEESGRAWEAFFSPTAFAASHRRALGELGR